MLGVRYAEELAYVELDCAPDLISGRALNGLNRVSKADSVTERGGFQTSRPFHTHILVDCCSLD